MIGLDKAVIEKLKAFKIFIIKTHGSSCIMYSIHEMYNVYEVWTKTKPKPSSSTIPISYPVYKSTLLSVVVIISRCLTYYCSNGMLLSYPDMRDNPHLCVREIVLQPGLSHKLCYCRIICQFSYEDTHCSTVFHKFYLQCPALALLQYNKA